MFRPFQLAKLVDKVPPGDDWLFEMKFDGYPAELNGGKVTLYSRSGLDWTRQFGRFAPAFEGWLSGLPKCRATTAGRRRPLKCSKAA